MIVFSNGKTPAASVYSCPCEASCDILEAASPNIKVMKGPTSPNQGLLGYYHCIASM